jgi:hypothetical protein
VPLFLILPPLTALVLAGRPDAPDWLRTPWRIALHSLLMVLGVLFTASNAINGLGLMSA